MIMEKLHGLQCTGLSLNDRFTMLASASVNRLRFPRQRRRSTGLFSFGQQINNRELIDQIAQRLGQQSRRQAVQHRLGIPALRRFGSESNLLGLRRSLSFGNLSERSVQNGAAWRQSNGNLSRTSSFTSLSQIPMSGRGFMRRGNRMGVMRGRMRARGVRPQIAGRVRGQAHGQRVALRGPTVRRQTGRGRARGQNGRFVPRVRGRGGARGGVSARLQNTVPTREELDLQLDQYMASTKAALDRELDAYMRNAMDLE